MALEPALAVRSRNSSGGVVGLVRGLEGAEQNLLFAGVDFGGEGVGEAGTDAVVAEEGSTAWRHGGGGAQGERR